MKLAANHKADPFIAEVMIFWENEISSMAPDVI